jgi:hypothetical protein
VGTTTQFLKKHQTRHIMPLFAAVARTASMHDDDDDETNTFAGAVNNSYPLTIPGTSSAVWKQRSRTVAGAPLVRGNIEIKLAAVKS